MPVPHHLKTQVFELFTSEESTGPPLNFFDVLTFNHTSHRIDIAPSFFMKHVIKGRNQENNGLKEKKPIENNPPKGIVSGKRD